MRKLILQEFLSLDARAADEKGSTQFAPESMQGDQSFGRHQLAFIDSTDTMLLGRVTYEMFAGHWPKVKSGDDKEFADKLNALKKVVVSKSLERAPWEGQEDATIIKDPSEVARLKEQPGKAIVLWGSLSVAQSLMKQNLIDEYQLVVCPVVLGDGRQFFEERAEMKLVRTQSFDRGGALLSYVKR